MPSHDIHSSRNDFPMDEPTSRYLITNSIQPINISIASNLHNSVSIYILHLNVGTDETKVNKTNQAQQTCFDIKTNSNTITNFKEYKDAYIRMIVTEESY